MTIQRLEEINEINQKKMKEIEESLKRPDYYWEIHEGDTQRYISIGTCDSWFNQLTESSKPVQIDSKRI